MEKIISHLPLIVQVALLAAALWYSWETRVIRLQNQKELNLLKKQGRLSLAPYLVPGCEKIDIEQLIELISSNEELDAEEKKEQIEAAKKEEVFFYIQVDNPTSDKVGCQLRPIIYDPSTKSFILSDSGHAWISPQAQGKFQATGPYYSKAQISEQLEGSYGDEIKALLNNLDITDNEGYVALFYRDIEGSLYLAKRAFKVHDGEYNFKATKLFSSVLD
ncbi:MAG: hypothetical protein R3E57_00550 [Porticoccaceae bacterium]